MTLILRGKYKTINYFKTHQLLYVLFHRLLSRSLFWLYNTIIRNFLSNNNVIIIIYTHISNFCFPSTKFTISTFLILVSELERSTRSQSHSAAANLSATIYSWVTSSFTKDSNSSKSPESNWTALIPQHVEVIILYLLHSFVSGKTSWCSR